MKYVFLCAVVVSALFFAGIVSVPHAFADCIPYVTAPNLYEVDRISSTSAQLYFTPLNDNIQQYQIDYGLNSEDRRYSVVFSPGPSSGAVSYTVNGLDPAFTYYYSVSATNSCSGSPWSNWVSDTVASASATLIPTSTPSNGPVTGSETLIFGGVTSSMLMGVGFVLYRKSRQIT
jgi:hypothetical protein